MRCLAIAILSVLSLPAFAQSASDFRIVDESARTPTEHLALANATTLEIRGVIDELKGWYALALYEDNQDRLKCLGGMEVSGMHLLGASERAARDLRPAVLTGSQAKAHREARQLRIALNRARQLYASGLECSHLVVQPIKPKLNALILPPVDQDSLTMHTDMMDLMSATPSW